MVAAIDSFSLFSCPYVAGIYWWPGTMINFCLLKSSSSGRNLMASISKQTILAGGSSCPK
jgi:hypothetical protein